jgi:uncharacterized Zn finger protein
MKDDLFELGGSMPAVDPRNYETIKCDKCGSIQFVNQYVLKKVSGMELGQGAKPMMLPLNILVCAKCGAILADDIKGYKLEKDLGLEDNTESKQINIENTSSLII